MVHTDIIKQSNRNYWMGWAMIMIILCHIQYTCYDDGYIMRGMRLLFKKGEFGVDIFLFLSVVGLSYSFERNKLSDFYIHRIKRLFPMYFFFLVLSFVFFKSDENIICDVFFQLTGLSNFLGNQFNEWYIPALIMIYVLFPLLFWSIVRLCKINMLICHGLIVLTIYSYIITRDLMTSYFARRLYLIVLGIVIYYIQRKDNNLVKIIDVLSFVAVIQLFVPSDYNMFLFVPLLLVVFDSFYYLPMRGIVSWIGIHSLEIYLGQTMGIIFFCNQSTLRILYKLPTGIIITVVSAVLLNIGHKFFYICLDKLMTKTESYL